jgi:ribosomal protein S21
MVSVCFSVFLCFKKKVKGNAITAKVKATTFHNTIRTSRKNDKIILIHAQASFKKIMMKPSIMMMKINSDISNPPLQVISNRSKYYRTYWFTV